MKTDKGLKIALIVLLIILVSIISFVGVFVQNKNAMANVVKDYMLGMDLKGGRTVAIAVDESTNTVYYDKDGKVVEEETKDGSKKEVPVNSKEVLNKENYIITKNIIEERLNQLGIADYLIRQDENTGKIIVQLPEDNNTSLASQYIYTVGKFTVEDEDEKVLLDNSNIKIAKVGYITETNGTTAYLNIEFNKDSIEKVKEISNTYVKSTAEDGTDNSKKIIIKIDGNQLISTSFSEEITDGILQLSVGTATNSSDINNYLQEASNLAILLNNGKFPITYKVTQNRYVQSDITAENIVISGLVTAVIIVIGLIILVVKYRKNGLIASISYVGYVALLLLVLRYANVMLTTEGLFGVLISMVLNYVFSVYLLKVLKSGEDEQTENKQAYNKTVLAMILVLVPSLIVGITLCFSNWLPMYSFGAIIFWGILLILAYNTLVTRTLVLLSSKK